MLIPTEMEAGVSLLDEKRGATAAITALIMPTFTHVRVVALITEILANV